MTVRALSAVLIGATIFLFGCSQDNRPDRLTFADLRDDDVVISVNGEEITWRAVRTQLDFEYAQEYFRNRDRQPDLSNELYTGYRAWRMKTLVGNMANTVLIRQAADKEGVSADPKRIKEFETEYLSIFSPLMKLGETGTVEMVANQLNVPKGYLADQFVRDAQRFAYLGKVEPRVLEITDAELKAAKARTAKFNANAKATNEVQIARAKEIVKKALSGEDFIELGKKYGDYNVGEAKYWTAYFWPDLKEDVKLRDWAFSAKIGDVGGPFDTKNGYSVVKLLKIDEGSLEPSAVSLALKRVYLARITLNVYDTISEVSDDARRARMKKFFYEKTMKDVLMKLQQEGRIYYTNGTNLWQRLPDWFSGPPPVSTLR